MVSLLLDTYRKMKFTGATGNSAWSFEERPHCSPKLLHHFPTRSGSNFCLHTPANTWHRPSFWYRHPGRHGISLRLVRVSRMTRDVLFVGLLAARVSSAGNISSDPLLVCNRVICLLTVELEEFLIYSLDTSPLSDGWFTNIFSHSVGCGFSFLTVRFKS